MASGCKGILHTCLIGQSTQMGLSLCKYAAYLPAAQKQLILLILLQWLDKKAGT